MFEGTSGSTSEKVCTSASSAVTTLATRQYESRQPLPERELIVIAPGITSTTIKTTTCPKCGTFEKSGRNSCCAPGGAWFKSCGSDRNKNVDHTWFEGMTACKRITTTTTV